MEQRWTRAEIAGYIVARLKAELAAATEVYRSQPLPYFVVDDLLPRELAEAIAAAFPDTASMTLKKSLRELKYVTAQMDRCRPILEEAIFAFHDAEIVSLIGSITGLTRMEPDRQLYAGGISVMGQGHFLNPHIDNSHDKQRERYRVLNLLYYTSPDWSEGMGGSLELWPDGPRGEPIVIPNSYNRLVVMATTPRSWHSVTQITTPKPRCCVSNYYFSPDSPEESDFFHVTSFRGRPEQPIRDFVLRADITLRMFLRKLRPRGVVENKHYYAKGNERRPAD